MASGIIFLNLFGHTLIVFYIRSVYSGLHLMQSPQQVEVDGLPESCHNKAKLMLASVGEKKHYHLLMLLFLGGENYISLTNPIALIVFG